MSSPVNQMEWWRVILDEAHLIKNLTAKQSEAVINLMAKRRWVVMGTPPPIQNGSFDLFSLMAFLTFEPFSIQNYWQSLVQRDLDQGKESALRRLQAYQIIQDCWKSWSQCYKMGMTSIAQFASPHQLISLSHVVLTSFVGPAYLKPSNAPSQMSSLPPLPIRSRPLFSSIRTF